MLVVKCCICGKQLANDDYLWEVLRITPDGRTVISAACSTEHAEIAKIENARMHRTRARDVENQEFQKIKVKQVLRQYE